MIRRTILGILALAFVGLFSSRPAKADSMCTAGFSGSSCTIDMTVTNGTTGEPSGYSYATVSLTLNNNGTITFDITPNSGWGLHNADFGFNYSGSGTLTASNISYTYAGPNPGNPTFTGSDYGNMDGFGKFTSGFNGGTGASSVYTSLSFTISTSTAGGFTSLSELINGNNKTSSNFFAAQMAFISTGCTGFVGNYGSTGGTNGFGSNSCTSPLTPTVPEPGTVALLGMGLLALIAVGAYRRHSLAV